MTIEAGTLAPGNYFCSLFINDSYDEVSPRINFTVEGESSGMANAGGAAAVVYPNPAADVLHVVVKEATEAALYNMAGGKVMQVQLSEGDNVLAVDGLPQGIYLLRTGNDGSTCHKVVKR